MSKRIVYKVGDLPKEISKITPKGSILTSRLNVFSDLQDPTKQYYEEITIDSDDIIKILKWLDENAPTFHATSDLRKAEKLMRESLMDIWQAVKDENDKHNNPK